MTTNTTPNTFEALTQTIIEKERQMKELAAQVAQQRSDVLHQMSTAMNVLGITVEDIVAHQASAQNGSVDSQVTDTDRASEQSAGSATTNLHEKVKSVAEAKAETAAEAAAKESASKEVVAKDEAKPAETTKPQTTARSAGPKFGGFAGKQA